MEYLRLTKMFIDENGNDTVRCALYQTSDCKNPDTYKCSSCVVMQYILRQLYEFEKVYTEGADFETSN